MAEDITSTVKERAREHLYHAQSLSDKAADGITSFVGSWLFVGIHSLWFLLWISLRVEPFPYGLLTMVVSLEAIYLSTFVMISQNRQGSKDHARDDLEAKEVDELHSMQSDLYIINRQQLEILNGEQGTKQTLDLIMKRLDELGSRLA